MKNNVVWIKGSLAKQDKTARALDEINKRLEKVSETTKKVITEVKSR